MASVNNNERVFGETSLKLDPSGRRLWLSEYKMNEMLHLLNQMMVILNDHPLTPRAVAAHDLCHTCLLYTSPSPRD